MIDWLVVTLYARDTKRMETMTITRFQLRFWRLCQLSMEYKLQC